MVAIFYTVDFKWTFRPYTPSFSIGLKWSAFENPSHDPQGVTEYSIKKAYRGTREVRDHEKALVTDLRKMTAVFKESLMDVIKRQENITNFLVPSLLGHYGASLGNPHFCFVSYFYF